MKRKKAHIYNILYILKIILFIPFLCGLIQLIPSIFQTGIIGIIFLVLTILYILNSGLIFLIKDKKINNNLLQNIMSILLYVYISLIAYRYITINKEFLINQNDMYFKLNYIIAGIGMLGALFNTATMINEK